MKFKKSISLNHEQLVFANKNHNFLHYLTVILIRLVKLIIFLPLAAYMFAFSYWLTTPTLTHFLPEDLFQNIIWLCQRLPYFSIIQMFLFQWLKNWYLNISVWLAMVIGLPLILISLAITATVILDFYYALFVPEFNHTHCPFCKNPIEIKKKENS